jgi:hypothetical protein
MSSGNRANQHALAHFPGLAVAYAASIRRALNYDLSSIPSDSAAASSASMDAIQEGGQLAL